MALREPNSEQKMAIEHTGGVLLQAGAGSGKTFVLVEHLVYLTKKFFSEHDEVDEDLRKKLAGYYSGIVVMTFTRKAAGELRGRVEARFEQQISVCEASESSLWEMALSVLDRLFMSTIHGFCLRLLSMDLIKGVPSDLKIHMDQGLNYKIEQLFYAWYESHYEKIDSAVMKLFSYKKQEIVKALVGIFNDPDLRYQWNQTNLEACWGEKLSRCYQDILESFEINVVFDLSGFGEYQDKAWYQLIEKFNQVLKTNTISSGDFSRFFNFFENVSRFPRKPNKVDSAELACQHIDNLKSFRDFLKKHAESLQTFEQFPDSFKSWAESLQNLVRYVEQKYTQTEEFSFSDLEYYVLQGLRDDETKKRISEQFECLIVDEFQDTSYTQFEIISKVLNEDFSRLFAVGDEKQAIYGFRGGELGVFWDCKKRVDRSLMLRNNYRSKSSIVIFNNKLFHYVLERGMGFRGLDKHRVEFVDQIIPVKGDESGHLYEVAGDESSINEWSVESVDGFHAYEAKIFKEHILYLMQNFPGEDICILYKTLGASKFLVKELTKESVFLRAQVKLVASDNPVLGVILLFIEAVLKEDSEQFNFESEMLDMFLRYLNFDQEINCVEMVTNFKKNLKLFGIKASIEKLLYDIGFVGSILNKTLSTLTTVPYDDFSELEKYWRLIRDLANEKLSVELDLGQGSQMVQIMTAHASKGLEFEHVLLGGIYTNGRTVPFRDFFGKETASLRWRKDTSSPKELCSPYYLLEGITRKQKDFSESKRLFYVACTRAVKSLSWLASREDFKSPENSWGVGLNDFLIQNKNSLKVEERKYTLDERAEKSQARPLFHKNNFGLVPSIGEKNLFPRLVFVSEASVTGLSTLAECPFKYYLKNICKLDVEELMNEETKVKQKSSSSAERGTLLHEVLHMATLRNFIIPREFVKHKDAKKIEWVLEQLKSLEGAFEFIPEKMIKFSFFGQMLSGTPDLVLHPRTKDENPQIWDYKTGRFEQSKLDAYWFQLKVYAYAYYVMGLNDRNIKTSIKILFLDEQKVLTNEVDYNLLNKDLFETWKRLEHLEKTNLEHCDHCYYGKICQANA